MGKKIFPLKELFAGVKEILKVGGQVITETQNLITQFSQVGKATPSAQNMQGVREELNSIASDLEQNRQIRLATIITELRKTPPEKRTAKLPEILNDPRNQAIRNPLIGALIKDPELRTQTLKYLHTNIPNLNWALQQLQYLQDMQQIQGMRDSQLVKPKTQQESTKVPDCSFER